MAPWLKVFGTKASRSPESDSRGRSEVHAVTDDEASQELAKGQKKSKDRYIAHMKRCIEDADKLDRKSLVSWATLLCQLEAIPPSKEKSIREVRAEFLQSYIKELEQDVKLLEKLQKLKELQGLQEENRSKVWAESSGINFKGELDSAKMELQALRRKAKD